MHEILTLQFGDYASFVGSHFWNLQAAASTHNLQKYADDESFQPYLDASSLFRQGINERTGQVTSYNPRVVIFEKQTHLGILNSQGLSTLAYSNVGTLKSKDFVRKQVEALERDSRATEVWLKKRHEGDSTEYIQNLNDIPSHSQWNTLLGSNLVEDSLRGDQFVSEEIREHSVDWASYYKWNQGDMMTEDNEEFEQQEEGAGTSTQNRLQANGIDKLEMIKEELGKNVKRWSDFLEPILNPKSICSIQDELSLYND